MTETTATTPAPVAPATNGFPAGSFVLYSPTDIRPDLSDPQSEDKELAPRREYTAVTHD